MLEHNIYTHAPQAYKPIGHAIHNIRPNAYLIDNKDFIKFPYVASLYYAPQNYRLLDRLAMETIATLLYVFGVVAILTLRAYDAILFPNVLVGISIGVFTYAILSIFRRYGAGYLNPLFVLAAAIIDWRCELRGHALRTHTGFGYQKKNSLGFTVHGVGYTFLAFILAQGIGATLAALLIWACFFSISATNYGFDVYNTAVFSSISIFVLDMLLYSISALLQLISGKKRTTIGKVFPLIYGAVEGFIHIITSVTTNGLFNITIWVVVAVLSNFGGLGITSTGALDGWLIFGANALSAFIGIVLVLLIPHSTKEFKISS